MRKQPVAGRFCAAASCRRKSEYAVCRPREDSFAGQDRGDFVLELKTREPLAEKRDVTAQMMVGMMYSPGQGVPQDQGPIMAGRDNRNRDAFETLRER